MKDKETRYLLFIAISIFLAILICITSITSANMFGIVVSIVLLALLCTGLGYLYCKFEDNIASVFKEKDEAFEQLNEDKDRIIAKNPTIIKKSEKGDNEF